MFKITIAILLIIFSLLTITAQADESNIILDRITNADKATNDVTKKSEILITSALVDKVFRSIQIISVSENLKIINSTDRYELFTVDSISCVFENYYACSFFTRIENERKMIVTLDGAELLINTMAKAEVPFDDYSARMDIDLLKCYREFNNTIKICKIIPFKND